VDLPTGTVTFLFSDIEGSTRLATELGPDAYRSLLQIHHGLLRAAFVAHGGVERGTQGDAFLVIFRDARSAVGAALDAQRALAQATWPAGVEVRIRMGLHSGEGIPGGDDYVGLDVNRAARIASAAHGGQILISDATRALVERDLAPGVGMRDLGRHMLKDLAHPERLFQLQADGLRSVFPPPRTLEARVGNLPIRRTSFVGRDAELRELMTLLADNRLVTLTGPGGTGKTSLAVELARQSSERFGDGAWFVGLEAISDPDVVGSAITAALGILETSGREPSVVLREYVQDRSLLLVLDNFEQVLPAAALVTTLLESAASLSVIVTSRAALHLRGEQEYPVQPLPVPAVRSFQGSAEPATAELAAIEASDAVRLFVERARHARPAFAMTPDTAAAVAETCRRVEGLPLAIELAAARTAILAPRTIAERLARHLPLPGSSPSDLPDRQRTIDRTVEWSCDLLGAPTQRLFARLSVFAGGWDLDAVESVCGAADDIGVDQVDGLAHLVEQSLVRALADGPTSRFALLEPVRDVAAARLAATDDVEPIRRRHMEHYLRLAETAAASMPGIRQAPWIARLSEERDNIRAAIAFAVTQPSPEDALRFAAALWRYWQFDGHAAEGMATVHTVLSMPGADGPSIERMRALEALGGLHYWAGERGRASEIYADQLALARQLGDRAGEADALWNLASATAQTGAVEESSRMLDAAGALYDDLGDGRGRARVEGIRSFLLLEGDVGRARSMMADVSRRLRDLDDAYFESVTLDVLAWADFLLGDARAALASWRIAMEIHRAMGDVASATFTLEFAAIVAEDSGRLAEAVELHSAFDELCRRYAIRPPRSLDDMIGREGYLDPAAQVLGRERYAEAEARGRGLTLDQAIDRARGVADQIGEPGD
jgi:predicted ATPase/class 3 adenylate cyclase